MHSTDESLISFLSLISRLKSVSVCLPPSFPLCFPLPPHPFQTGLELHALRFFRLSSLQSNKILLLLQQAADLQGGPDEYQASLITFVDVLHWRSSSRKLQRMCILGNSTLCPLPKPAFLGEPNAGLSYAHIHSYL